MELSPRVEKFKKIIERQRLNPKLWDFSFLMLKNNLFVFNVFKDLINKEEKIISFQSDA